MIFEGHYLLLAFTQMTPVEFPPSYLYPPFLGRSGGHGEVVSRENRNRNLN